MSILLKVFKRETFQFLWGFCDNDRDVMTYIHAFNQYQYPILFIQIPMVFMLVMIIW